MPNLPESSDFTGAGVTEGQFKTAMTALRGYLVDLLGANGTKSTALKTLGSLGSAQAPLTANHTVVLADRGKVFNVTDEVTLTLTTVATLGADFAFGAKNSGTAVAVLNPAGEELIDGLAELEIKPGQSCFVISTSIGWITVSLSGGTGLVGVSIFTDSGLWTKPTGLDHVIVEVVGGGGNGSGGVTTATSPTNIQNVPGTGGSSAGYAKKRISADDLGSSVDVVVANQQQTSSFGSHVSATGGNGTSSPGVGVGGDINLRGACAVQGIGADSHFGGGGLRRTAVGNGLAAQANSGGGGGPGVGSGTSGAVGAKGIVIVWEYA